MKNTTRQYFVIPILFAMASLAVAGSSDRWAECDYLPGRMIISFTAAMGSNIPVEKDYGVVATGIPELDELFEEFEVTKAWRLVPDQILDKLHAEDYVYRSYVMMFRNEYPVLDVLDRFTSCTYVYDAEPDILRKEFRVPNDGLWASQYDKRLCGGPEVWDISTGSPDILCCGIDTGVDWNHPDIRPILWVNPGEDADGDGSTGDWEDYPGDTDDLDGSDNEDNGYVDDFLGWDFIRSIGGCNTCDDCDNINDNDMFGCNDHGTHVGGIMEADGDNGIGVCGWSWGGRLMALRAGYEDTQGQGYMPGSATVPAIYYAAANGANILNMSYGGGGQSQQDQTAINTAWDAGCMLFAATGNDGSTSPQYPANYNNVIGVNAIDGNDELASWSNRGTWTELCAPGVSIQSTVINGYAVFDGTSMASPNAGGVAALVWSVFPDMTNAEIRDLLYDSADDISAQNPDVPPNQLGHGRVSASGAVSMLFPMLTVAGTDITDSNGDNDGRLESGESGTIVISVHDDVDWAAITGVNATVTTDNSKIAITNGSFSLGTINSGQTVNNSGDPVSIAVVQPFYEAFWATINVHFTGDGGYQSDQTFQLRVGRGLVLVVDDEASTPYEQHYASAVTAINYTPDIWNSSLDGTVTANEMGDYGCVIWSCGNDASTSLTAPEQAVITDYLNGGGNMIVAGQGIDNDISGEAFYGNILHAATDGHQAGDRVIGGLSGNPISNGMDLLLIGSCADNGNTGPDRILAANGGVQAFVYNTEAEPEGVAAVMYGSSQTTYQILYCAFALEAACGLANSEDLSEALAAVLAWMEVSDTPNAPDVTLPTTIELQGNYPNPFNPTTTIVFSVSSPTHVKLSVFDILGREVGVILNGFTPAGEHSITFDGSSLASGVYLTQLQAGDVVRTSKMVLLK